MERNYHSKVTMSVTPNSKHRFPLIHKMASRKLNIVGKVPLNRQTYEIYLELYIQYLLSFMYLLVHCGTYTILQPCQWSVTESTKSDSPSPVFPTNSSLLLAFLYPHQHFSGIFSVYSPHHFFLGFNW